MRPSSETGSWQPLLTGTFSERAVEAIAAIADALRELPADFIPENLPRLYQQGAGNNPSLSAGRAGLALFYAYLAQAWSRDADRQTATRLLEESVDLLARTQTRPSLFAGFAGVAWVAQHLRGWIVDAGDEDPNEDIDQTLEEHLHTSPWRADYDLVHGLVGFGVYALQRLPRDTATACLELVIDRLAEIAEHDAQGTTWRTPLELVPPVQRAQAPQGYHNLGVAHGVPGVIGFLGQVCAAGVASDKARLLLDGAVRWLLSQQTPDAAGFPYWIAADRQPEVARLAWCYGNPGIAATLLHAARCVGETAWERAAVEIAHRATERPPENAGVLDASLCHGAAGLGHLFNRMHQATGDAKLGEAARSWFERALSLRKSNGGIAGFAAWMSAPDGERGWVDDPHFLTGAAGIGLALLAATTTLEPAWDRVLLTSVPPGGEDAAAGSRTGR